MDYEQFIEGKVLRAPERGMENIPPLCDTMFPHQKHVAEFLLRVGCGAAFLDTGLGKSLISLDWGRVVSEHTGKPVLMFAPLAVSRQHEREGRKFGIPVRVVKSQEEIGLGVNVTNYERLHLFSPVGIGGLILDESSIIKGFTGKTTRALMAFGESIAWKIAATATPAPNDHMELGQHSQFLGVMESSEMLARWFIADQSEMGRYRLKRHGIKPFWSWAASWARCITKPSDIGFDDAGFDLPKLNTIHHIVEADITQDTGGALFRIPNTSATEIHKEKRLTAEARGRRVAEIVRGQPSESWIIWCETDYEADAVMACLPNAVEVRGSMPADEKERRLVAFTEEGGVLVTKPSIAGFGLNWQHCARVCFMGLSFSFESYYQAIRRCWRFGQSREVECHIVMADTEEAILRTVQRKAVDHENMKREMAEAMGRETITKGVRNAYAGNKPIKLPSWVRGAA